MPIVSISCNSWFTPEKTFQSANETIGGGKKGKDDKKLQQQQQQQQQEEEQENPEDKGKRLFINESFEWEPSTC